MEYIFLGEMQDSVGMPDPVCDELQHQRKGVVEAE